MVSSFVLVLRTRYCLGMQIKQDEMSGGVARMEEKRNAYGFSVGEVKEKKHLKDLNVDGGVILN